jgi:hypothetical protein
MTNRMLVVLATLTFVLPVVGAIWFRPAPRADVTAERARHIQTGMTARDVEAILGGPPGDYVVGAAVTYSRGGVGADESKFYEGTNWWGTQGVIQVQFSKAGLVEDANFYPAHSVRRVGLWDRPQADPPGAPPGIRHDWVAAYW